MLVNTEELYEALGNVKLLLSAGGAPHVEFLITQDKLKISASDGHMYIQTTTEPNYSAAESNYRFGISPESAKDMERIVVATEDEFIDLQFDGPQVYVGRYSWESFVTAPEFPPYILMNHKLWEWSANRPFNFMQDRIRKLSLIKPRGKYPLSLKLVYHSGIEQDILLFKVGPRCQGALSLLDRELLDSTLDDENSTW